jgi:predicted nucleic acid-binding protein
MLGAALVADLARTGKTMAVKDSMIAATAIFHKLTVATRNQRDFENAGLDVVNPFE